MNIDSFLSTLPYMAKGMIGIFIVTAVLILSIVLTNKLTTRKSDNSKDEK